MPKTAYHISFKGYVGGYDFDRSTVDSELAKNEGKQVNVHFVGLNASAATIASLGAAHISIDAGARVLQNPGWQVRTVCASKAMRLIFFVDYMDARAVPPYF